MGMCKECGVVFPVQDMINGFCKEHSNEDKRIKTKHNNEIEIQNINTNSVVIVDIKMPFLSMVIFMIKWSIASIPAFIIITILAMIVGTTIGGGIGFISR